MSIIGRRIPAFATTMASDRAVHDAETEAKLAEWRATFNECFDILDKRTKQLLAIEAAAKSYLDDLRRQKGMPPNGSFTWSSHLDELDKAIRS